jgi:TolB-like protein/tetratricopeptide (TPR) repeat protein
VASDKPAEKDVLAALQNLLAWPEIARSTQLSRFLDYVVRATLRGEEGSIKAYSIAVDVLGRPAHFDPQSDPIVRVQARRLRGLIAQYYASAGQGESVRIDLPTGRYVPEFVVVDPVTVLAPPAPSVVYPEAVVDEAETTTKSVHRAPVVNRQHLLRSWSVLALATLMFGAVAITFSLRGMENERAEQVRYLTQPLSVKVMEFQRLSQTDDDVSLTAGLAIDLVSKLNSSGLVVASYGGTSLTQQMDADFVLSGTVRRDGGEAQYSAILTDTATGQVSWSRVIRTVVEGRSSLGLTDEVSLRLATGLSNINGPVLAPVREILADQEINVVPSLYLCRVIYSGYRADLSPAAAARSNRCYAQLSPDVRATGEVQAAQALLIMGGAAGSDTENVDIGLRTAMAEELLRTALTAEPLNAFVWTQFARFSRERGDFENEEMAYGTAQKLDPSNAEVLAAYSQSLAIAGRRQEAMQLFDIAIESSSNPPGWYYITPAMVALAQEDWEAVGRYAVLLQNADNLTAPLFGVLAGYGLNDAEQLNRALPRLLDTRSFRENGIMPQLARRITDAQLLNIIRQSLSAAGVPNDRLDRPY